MRTALHPPAHHHRLGRRSKVLLLLFPLGVITAVAGPLATGAGAEVSGGCTATLAGQNVAPLSSTKAGDAIDVNAKDQIVAAATSAAAIDGYKVQMEMGGFKWTVASGTASGNSWQRAVSVNKYASHGVGLYKVIGTSTGAGACTGAVLVNVKGKSPLATTAGIVGIALTGIGGVGIVASAARAIRMGSRTSGKRSVLALLSLPAMMMVGMGVSGPMPLSASPGRQQRNGWRPRLSLLGMLSGAFGGLGVIVLLQQYAVAYPTRGLALTGILGGVVLSLLTTNLLPLLARGKAEPTPSVAEVTEEVVADVTDESLAAAGDTNLFDAGEAPTWAPTHAVPASGLAAWAEPDELSGVPADKLDPGLQVAVFEHDGTWAHIRCSNGWSAWVDGQQLVELSR